MLASAGGSGEIRSGGLVIKGLNPAALQPLLQGADGLTGEIDIAKVKPLVEGVLWNGEIPLGEVSMPFTISDGTLRMQNLSASTDRVTLSGATNVDFAQQNVTGDIDLSFNAGNEALAGAEPSIRLNFAGPLSEPELTTDISAMTGFLSLRAYERERRRVEALQASVLEKQRLRREAALYTYRVAERQAAKEKAEADERARVAEEVRLRAEQEEAQRKAAEEKAAQDKVAAEKAAQEKAAQDRQQQQNTPTLSIPPTEEVIRQFSPQPPGTATP
jgi:flagellar biosynthesis GTPase FlhF